MNNCWSEHFEWLFKWVDYACSKGAVWGHFDFKMFRRKYTAYRKISFNFHYAFCTYGNSPFSDTSFSVTGRKMNMVTLLGISIMNFHVYIVINKICIFKIRNELLYNENYAMDCRDSREKNYWIFLKM